MVREPSVPGDNPEGEKLTLRKKYMTIQYFVALTVMTNGAVRRVDADFSNSSFGTSLWGVLLMMTLNTKSISREPCPTRIPFW